MKPKPLDNKEIDITITSRTGIKYEKAYLKNDIKSAVEWLKELI